MVPSAFTRKFLIVLSVIICVLYLIFRVGVTLNTTGPYALTISILLYAAEVWGILNLFLFFVQVWEVREPPAEPVLEGRSVDIFVPTFNEDPTLLRATLEACVRMDYPHKTYVLDDGRRPEVEALARELGIEYISRPDNRHFKAGNLNYAFERTDGEFVVVLDADHVPEPHFITRLIGYFRDDRLGYVQTPHAFYNFDSFQARLDHKNRRYWEEGHLFYYVIQPGRNKWNCPIFAGSAAMFRRAAIRDVGLMATETITEDLHTGLRMNAKGWKSMSISERLVAGQAAPDITTFHAQRLRWGTGNLSIMKYDNPLTTRGLTIAQRLCYLGSIVHWASGPFKLIIYLTPIAMLFSGIPPVKEFTWELLEFTLVYLLVSLTTLKIVSNGYGSIINSELFAMVNFWTQIKSVFRAVFGLGSRHFHVTPKGAAAVEQRKQKSVWPFIRPQTYLIILSVLALFWGWGRLVFDGNMLLQNYPVLEKVPLLPWLLHHSPSVGFGISDDYFKPVVPTIWVLLHFWLAYKVTQRAFWPADRRLTTRHVVHVPIEYDTAAATGSPRYGVTVDLNDTGMAFVAYERFSPGDVLRLVVRGAGEVVKCKGEIRTVADLTQGQSADGFRYGVLFQNLTPPQVDALNRICLHYGVPRMYKEFDGKRGGFLGGFQKRMERGMAQRRSSFRNQYRLPIVVNSGVTEDTAQFGATEDLSRNAVASLLDHDLPKNTPVGYLMATPLGEVRGTARVLRTTPEIYGGRTYYRTVMEFGEFEGQGRTTLQSLVNPQETGGLKEALKPDRKPILVHMAGATLVAILIAVPLLLLQGGIFKYYHRDDHILRDIGMKDIATVTPDDTQQVGRIYDDTMAQGKSPTSDRLVLLMKALKVYDRREQQLNVAERLAGLNKHDLTLQQTLIYAQAHAMRWGDAELTYENLEKQKGFDRFTEEQKYQYRLSGARVAEGRASNPADLGLAIERYRDLYKEDANRDRVAESEKPGGVPLRREYAGVLLKAGAASPKYYDDAKSVLQTAKPDDIDSRKMLVAAYLLKGRAMASLGNKDEETREYAKAEEVAEQLSGYASQKGNRDLEISAERMRADIQMARRQWEGARNIVEKLVEAQGGGNIEKVDTDLIRRLAHIQLGLGNYPGAMTAFESLLENKRLKPEERGEVIKGFLDAAANQTVNLADRERLTALNIHGAEPSPIDNDAVYLARLGWVLQRVRQQNESKESLKKAVQQAPNNIQIKEQLANILIQSGEMEQAALVLQDVNAFKARRALAGEYMRTGDLPAAEGELRRIIKENPVGYKGQDDYVVTPKDFREVELMLGNVLDRLAVRRGNDRADAFAVAIDYYKTLDKKYPNDAEVAARLGHIYLWAGERAVSQADKDEAYTNALKQFQRVIASKNFVVDPEGKHLASRGKVEQGFIDAAASAPTLDATQMTVARELAARRMTGDAPDPVSSARLAWVLLKSKDPDQRKEGLDLVHKAAGGVLKPEERRELAGVLAAAKEFKAAADLLVPARATVEDSIKIADLYAGARQWDLAEQELNKIRQDATATQEVKTKATRELAKVLAWAGKHTEALALIGEIVKLNSEDIEMRILQADVNVWAKNLDQALALYLPLIKEKPDNVDVQVGFANAAAKSKAAINDDALAQLLRLADIAARNETKDALLVARVAEAYATRLKDPARAKQLAQKAANLDPKNPIVRREVAFVLAHPLIGLYKEADVLFTGMELVGEERKQYVFIASQAENYDAARRQARLYLAEQLPGSLKEREARRLLADVLTWKGDYEDALALYERLAEEQPKDRDLKIEIAQVYRYWQNYPMALAKFADLVGEDRESKALAIGLVDAASSAGKSRILPQKPLLMSIYDKFGNTLDDIRFISRLAWVMYQLDEPARAHPLLTRALAANPQQADVRKELAGALAALDRRVEAIQLLTVPDVLATLDITELLNLADMLTAENQLERAELELSKVVTDRSDRRSRVRYASILLWNGKYARAQEMFVKLSRDFPEDREIMLLVAQSYLWAKDYTNALRRFTDLVVLRPDPKDAKNKDDVLANPEVWRGFIDAASGSAGESLRDFPRRSIGPLFNPVQREAIFRAYTFLNVVREKTLGENKIDLDRLNTPGNEKDPSFEGRKRALSVKSEAKVKGLAGSMGRLGLLLGLLGDRDKSTGAFGAALALDRTNRDVWLQYAQTLTALGDDQRAKAVFDWLIANPATKGPGPAPGTNGANQ
jgi:cellulose synthase/poly-beta-1,6-N-acetylglucosamine synthase-like glycosyltransferase/thioredoxin-like negative regulator of GroEL